MPAWFENDGQRDAFLAEPRLAILMTNRPGGPPIGVPVWFEWTGIVVNMFAARGTPKLKRIERDPQASVLVTNHINEKEVWVAFDGPIQIHDQGAAALISRIGPRYWDLSDPQLKATYDQWIQGEEFMVLMTLTPSKIRSGA